MNVGICTLLMLPTNLNIYIPINIATKNYVDEKEIIKKEKVSVLPKEASKSATASHMIICWPLVARYILWGPTRRGEIYK